MRDSCYPPILAALHSGHTVAQSIADVLGLPKHTVQSALWRLSKKGLVMYRWTPREGTTYRLPLTFEEFKRQWDGSFSVD
jgi:predicted ArsR family transcriptional regulator